MEDVLSLDSFCEFCSHAWVHFDCRAVLCLFQYSHSQVSRSRTDFKDFIRRAEVCLDSETLITH